MRFEHIKARGIGPFADVDIDLSAIPGRLVAVTGANGAGKSTLLELLAGGMYRTTPTRGSLADLAKSRDAMLEVGVRNGKSYTLRHVVDCISKKGEAVALDASGATLTDAGKVRELDAWVAKHLPVSEVLYTSTFAPQGSGGFLELKPADRKRVLLRVLGIERLEALAARASAKAKDALADVRTLEQRLADERSRAQPLEEAEEAARAAEAALATARDVHAAAEARVRDAERAAEAQRAALEERSRITHRIDAIDVDLLLAVRRRLDSKPTADRAEIVESARVRAQELAADLELVRTSLTESSRALAQAERDQADAERQTEARHALGKQLDAVRSALVEAEASVKRHEATVASGEQIGAARASVERLAPLVETVRRDLTFAREALSVAERDDAQKRAELAGLQQQLAAALKRLEVACALMVNADAVRGAAARLPAAEAELRGKRARVEALNDEAAAARLLMLSVNGRRIEALRGALTEISDGCDPIPRAASALAGDESIGAEASAAPNRVREAQESARALGAEADADEHDLRKVQRLADQLATVERAEREQAEARAEVERLQTRIDAGNAMSLAASGTMILRAAVLEREGELRGLEGQLADARRVADGAAELARAEAALEAARANVDRLRADAAKLQADLDLMPLSTESGCRDALRRAQDHHARLEAQAGAMKRDLSDAERLASLAGEVARAVAEVESCDREIARFEAEIRTLRDQLGDLPSATPVDVDAALAEAEEAHGMERRAAKAQAEAAAALTVARASDERARDLEALRETAHGELADWNRLAADLGKDGLQALEIDAAGPELTAIANDLLHSCVSRRWTLEVRTQRTSADGKRQIEGCDVVVVDTERGREGEAETFSGGERVMLGEAISLALSVLACRRIGVVGPTLVRDESGAALDAANGRAYVAMLRRAAELIGADKVLFVSHTPELQELADARIHVEGGRAVVIA